MPAPRTHPLDGVGFGVPDDVRAGTIGLDVPRVTAWMQGALADVSPPVHFRRIGDGRSNLTFRAEDGAGRAWVLRRPPLGTLLRGAHDVAREHRLLAALHPTGVRVPEPLGLCEDEDVTGAPFYVMELAEGIVVSERADLEGLATVRRGDAGRSLVDALVGLHAVDVDRAGLGDLARRTGYADRQLRGWWRQWEASRTRDVPAVEAVRDRLAERVPEHRRLAVVHGDYKLENVVVGADGEVRAILDWELCTLGDPIADLGTLLAYWSEPGDPVEWAIAGADAPTRAAGFPSRRELVERYAQRSGEDLDALPFYEALACWRLAIIAQGIARRFQDTPANANADAGTFTALVDALLDRAAALVR